MDVFYGSETPIQWNTIMRRKIVIERAERLNQVPPNAVKESDQYKKRLQARGIEPIDLTIGRLDFPVPSPTATSLVEAIEEMANERPASATVVPEFQEAFARWFSRRFDVDLDPETQVLPLMGSKTGVACGA